MVKPFSKVWLHLIGKYWDSKEHSAEGRTEELQLANLGGIKETGTKKLPAYTRGEASLPEQGDTGTEP